MKPKSIPERRKEFAELAEANVRVRKQFINAELQVCLTTLQMGEFELASGDLAVAKKELSIAQKGIETILRFLPGVGPEDKRKIDPKIAELHKRVESLKSNLRSASLRIKRAT